MIDFEKELSIKVYLLFIYLLLAYLAGLVFQILGLIMIGIASILYYYLKVKGEKNGSPASN